MDIGILQNTHGLCGASLFLKVIKHAVFPSTLPGFEAWSCGLGLKNTNRCWVSAFARFCVPPVAPPDVFGASLVSVLPALDSEEFSYMKWIWMEFTSITFHRLFLIYVCLTYSFVQS